MLEAAWRPPGWASKPTGSPRFFISKDGIDVGQLTLSDRAILFGRKVPNEPERGTVRLDHDSISRQHAAVVHSFTGETFVIDLGSRFGTTVDGEKLIPQKYTPIKDGAVVVFGASTRAYAFAVRPPKDGAAAGVRGVAIPPPAAATSAGAAGSTAGARPRPPPPPGTLGDGEVDPMANYVSAEAARPEHCPAYSAAWTRHYAAPVRNCALYRVHGRVYTASGGGGGVADAAQCARC